MNARLNHVGALMFWSTLLGLVLAFAIAWAL